MEEKEKRALIVVSVLGAEEFENSEDFFNHIQTTLSKANNAVLTFDVEPVFSVGGVEPFRIFYTKACENGIQTIDLLAQHWVQAKSIFLAFSVNTKIKDCKSVANIEKERLEKIEEEKKAKENRILVEQGFMLLQEEEKKLKTTDKDWWKRKQEILKPVNKWAEDIVNIATKEAIYKEGQTIRSFLAYLDGRDSTLKPMEPVTTEDKIEAYGEESFNKMLIYETDEYKVAGMIDYDMDTTLGKFFIRSKLTGLRHYHWIGLGD